MIHNSQHASHSHVMFIFESGMHVTQVIKSYVESVLSNMGKFFRIVSDCSVNEIKQDSTELVTAGHSYEQEGQ